MTAHPTIDHATAARRPRRWLILAVLCASVFVVVLDGTIVNVALPTLATELGASTSELQWIVDAYVLVFAGLLMAAGSLGDRFGRKGVDAGRPRAVRRRSPALGALVRQPRRADRAGGRRWASARRSCSRPRWRSSSTSSPSPRSGPSAIAVWAATAGVAVALGPVTGGWLLEHFWWGSVLMINVPVIAVALVAIAVVVPTSRDTTIARFDPLGTLLSIAGITLLVWAVIEGPVHGWTSPTSLVAFAVAAVLLAGFVAWERRIDHPMLDVSVFANLRFTAGSVAVTFAFFALFGFVFVVTQYFQFVRGYSALEAGVRTVPFAVFTASTAPLSPPSSPSASARRRVVTAGLRLDGRRLRHRRRRPASTTPYCRDRRWRCSSWAAASASSRRRPRRRSWARCRRPRPASARPSTTPPASSAARSASPSSAACSPRSTPPGSATPWSARRCRPTPWPSPGSRSGAATEVARQAGADSRPGGPGLRQRRRQRRLHRRLARRLVGVVRRRPARRR